MKMRYCFTIIVLIILVYFTLIRCIPNAVSAEEPTEVKEIKAGLEKFDLPEQTKSEIVKKGQKFLASSMQRVKPKETKGKENHFVVFKCPNKKCGLGVEEEDSFCSNCGEKLNKEGRNAVIIKQLMRDMKILDELDSRIAKLEKQYIENHRKAVSEEIQRKTSMIRTLEENLRLPDGFEYGTVVGIAKDGHLVIETPASEYPPDYEHQRTYNVKIPHY